MMEDAAREAEYARMMRRNHLNTLYLVAALGGLTLAGARVLDRFMQRREVVAKTR